MGVATNGTYDALKYLFIYLLTFFSAGESDEIDNMMRKAAERFRQALDSLPNRTADELLSKMETINLFKDNYKERIKEELLKDELLAALFNEPNGNLNLLIITMSFEDIFIEV